MAGINLDSANSQFTNVVTAQEDQLAAKIASADPNDMRSMLDLQQNLQKWTLATNLQSNAMKTLADGIKSTIQNLR